MLPHVCARMCAQHLLIGSRRSCFANVQEALHGNAAERFRSVFEDHIRCSGS
jgi:hypothetical protein